MANPADPGPATFAYDPAEWADGPVPAEPSSAPSEGQSRRIEAGPPIREAIEQLQRINRDLELLHLEMQKALETLEEAEVQKYADERDIESLRAALRQLNRTRENVQRAPQHSPSRQDNRPRHPQRDHRSQQPNRQRSGPRPDERQSEGPRPPEHTSEEPSSAAEEHRPERPHDPEMPF